MNKKQTTEMKSLARKICIPTSELAVVTGRLGSDPTTAFFLIFKNARPIDCHLERMSTSEVTCALRTRPVGMKVIRADTFQWN